MTRRRAASGCSPRPRILWLIKGLGPGGAERLLLSFAGLADQGRFDITAAYLLPNKSHLVPDLQALGVPVTCLFGSPVGDLRWVPRLLSLVRSHNFDVVHVHSPLVAAIVRPVLRAPALRPRPALVGTEHNLWNSYHPATRWANRITLPLQSTTLAVSEQVRRSMPRRIARRTEVVIHGVDVDAIAARAEERRAARAELGLGADDVAVVTIANLREKKDYPTLLRAAAQVLEQVPHFRFFAVGQGPLAERLCSERDALGLGHRFRFMGYQQDPIAVLVAADIFCLSSRYEGLPISLLEAMAAGLPVVATSVGGIPAVVRDGVEGRLVPPGDHRRLASAIAQLAPQEYRRRLAEAASLRSREYGIRAAVERQQQIYSDSAARRHTA